MDRVRGSYGDEHVSWRFRDIITSVVLFGVLATVTTVTVVGGGGFLLLISPLLLIFSPILVPLAIFATVVGGGALAFFGFLGSLYWFYRYWTGGRPYGAESVDHATGKVKQTTSYFTDKVGDLTGYGQAKAHDTYSKLSGSAA